MIICPVCGFRNLDANLRCFRCSALLKRDDDLLREATATADRKGRRKRLHQALTGPIDWLLHRPWISNLFAVPEDGPFKYPFTAGLLSIIPGAGHWYAGQIAKGWLLFLAGSSLAVFALAVFYTVWSNYVLLAVLVFWLLVWADSVAVAVQANGDRWRFRNTLALWFAAMMLVGVSVSALQLLGVNFVSLQKVTSDAMAPHIRDGDRIMFTSVPLWFRDPKAGEIVMFDPPLFSAEQGQDKYSINIRKYFQRVLGAPGDRVEKRGGHFYRNGILLGGNDEPFNGRVLPDFDLVVPADFYFIPVTNIPADMLAGLLGAGSIGYVGEPGFVFSGWPQFAIISEDDIFSKGLAIIDPPPRRGWLD